MVPLALSGSSRWNPSLTLIDRPFSLTSHRRTKRSAYGLSVRCTNSTTGLPITSSASFSGGPVNVRTSSRLLQFPVVAAAGDGGIDDPAADRGSGIRRVVDEGRWAGRGRRRGLAKPTLGLQVEHALGGGRRPFRQVTPLLGAGDEDADRAGPTPATGPGEVLRQPVQGLFHQESGALGGGLDMGPRANGQARHRRRGSRSRGYCSIICSGNRSIQPSCNKTGTSTRSSA